MLKCLLRRLKSDPDRIAIVDGYRDIAPRNYYPPPNCS